jgi:hypothetical protein
MRVRVEGTHFVKDTKTTALLATNRAVLAENEARKKLGERISGKNEEINTLKSQVNILTEDMSEIKKMLQILLEKNN